MNLILYHTKLLLIVSPDVNIIASLSIFTSSTSAYPESFKTYSGNARRLWTIRCVAGILVICSRYLVSMYKAGQSRFCHAEFISASRSFNGL
jgi:hypothetical protein